MQDNRKTIEDFGRQWTVYRNTTGYAGSVALLADYIAPLDQSIFQDARAADIGAGNGRFSLALLEAGAREVVAVEPSCSIDVIREKAKQFPDGVLQPLHAAGDQIPGSGDFDVIISLGVIHHIEKPESVVSAAYAPLRPAALLSSGSMGMKGTRAILPSPSHFA